MHTQEISAGLLTEADKRDLGFKFGESAVLTDKVASSLDVAVDTAVRVGDDNYEVSTVIRWELDLRNELGTVFYGELPAKIRVDIAEGATSTEPDYGRAVLCIRDAAAGFVRETCSDG